MADNPEDDDSETRHIQRLWHRCLEHAGDLIAAAERLMGDKPLHHIAYHLGLLALEELGKANMIVARAVLTRAGRPDGITKQLDDHVDKLLWAVWAPGFPGEKLTPQSFREARQFAESSNERRMAGLYVDFNDTGDTPSPREAVAGGGAENVIQLAKALLEVAQAREPVLTATNDDLQWFAAALDNERRRTMLFSAEFNKKHGEVKSTQEWFTWARTEIERLEREEVDFAQRELARQAADAADAKPRWRLKARIRTPSHSIRPKALAVWNAQFSFIRLREVQNHKDELIVEIELTDEVTALRLHEAGMSVFMRVMLALNVSTAGFFWYEVPRQGDSFFYEAEDLLNPGMKVELVRGESVKRVWQRLETADKHRGPPALSKGFIYDAVQCLVVLGSLTDSEAKPIVGNYLWAMSLLSKFDIHISFEVDVARLFRETFRAAMKHFGDWDGAEESFRSAFDKVFEPVLLRAEDRAQIFELIGPPNARRKIKFDDVIALKRMVDIYLITTCRRLAPRMLPARSGEADAEGESEGESDGGQKSEGSK
jgi:AbiV family abortive infection protein